MTTSIYNWLKEILIFFLVVSILEQLTANESYRKYIRQFAGIMFLILFISPLMNLLFGSGSLDTKIEKSNVWAEYEAQVKDGEYLLDKQLTQSQENVTDSCCELIQNILEADGIKVEKVEINEQDLTVTLEENQDMAGVQEQVEQIISDGQITGVKNIEVVKE